MNKVTLTLTPAQASILHCILESDSTGAEARKWIDGVGTCREVVGQLANGLEDHGILVLRCCSQY